VNGSKARTAAITGLEAIAILIPRYAGVENVYLGKGDEVSTDLRNAIVELYVNILDYQIEVARYLAHSAFQRFAKAAFRPGDWDDRLKKIKLSDDECKSLINVCDARFVRHDVGMMKDMIKRLDNSIEQQISAIVMSRNLVAWDPGPNTDIDYLSVLYSGSHGRASSFRIPLADIENDEQLFRMIQRHFALRQHPLWKWEVRHPAISLAPLAWYDVQKIEYVKVWYGLRFVASRTDRALQFMPSGSLHAKYAISPTPTVTGSVPAEIRLSAWHHPIDDNSTRCLEELHGILNDSQRWGLLIVEGFSVTNFSRSMFISIGLCFIVGMAADDFGYTVGRSLRMSFLGFLAQVLFLGILPHPASTDVVREEITFHRLATWGLCILAALFSVTFGHMVSDNLRRSFNACVMIVLLWVLVPHPPLRNLIEKTTDMLRVLIRSFAIPG
jgi:hypothetical protein